MVHLVPHLTEDVSLSPMNCYRAINIPIKDVEKYKATLSHKANHNFGRFQKVYYLMETARFGLLLSIKTLVPIKKDDEIFVDYGMRVESGPQWYRDAYEKFYRIKAPKRQSL